MCNKPLILALLAGLSLSGAAQAALFDRGGGMIYDDVLDITWLQDANYAKTSGYDADGRMNFTAANAWAAGLSYGGYEDWRLPTLSPGAWPYAFSTNGTQAVGYGATGTGYGTATPAGGWGPTGDADGIWSEMGWMYYHNLGNLGRCTPNDADPASCVEQSGWGLANTGLFTNLQAYMYWSGLEYAPNPFDAWFFYTNYGRQLAFSKDNGLYAWAVRSGDVAAVPEPATLLLLGLGLAGLGAMRRRG